MTRISDNVNQGILNGNYFLETSNSDVKKDPQTGFGKKSFNLNKNRKKLVVQDVQKNKFTITQLGVHRNNANKWARGYKSKQKELNLQKRKGITITSIKDEAELLVFNKDCIADIEAYTAFIDEYTAFTDDKVEFNDAKANKGEVELDEATKELARQQILEERYSNSVIPKECKEVLTNNRLKYLVLNDKHAVQELAKKRLIETDEIRARNLID